MTVAEDSQVHDGLARHDTASRVTSRRRHFAEAASMAAAAFSFFTPPFAAPRSDEKAVDLRPQSAFLRRFRLDARFQRFFFDAATYHRLLEPPAAASRPADYDNRDFTTHSRHAEFTFIIRGGH